MNLSDLPGLSATRIEALGKAGIETCEDLLLWFPHRYIDRSRISTIGALSADGGPASVAASLTHIQETGFGRKKRLEAIFEDGTGTIKGVWFHGVSYMKRLLSRGERYLLFGTVKRYGRNLSIAHPEVEPLSSDRDLSALQAIRPVYPGNKAFSRARITDKLISGWIGELLEKSRPEEFLPDGLPETHGWPRRDEAFAMIHFPKRTSDASRALERFKFEELFLFELVMARLRHIHFEKKPGPQFTTTGSRVGRFLRERFPHELTDGQKSALAEIKKDLFSGYQMHRLLQGDVGSGKTVVALVSMLLAVDNGYQAALMAPTEILAEQHYRTLSGFLDGLDLEIRLLKGGQGNRLRRDLLTSIEGGRCQMVVGTHAVIQQQVRFHRLGLAVIDEQHRFGVRQRAEMVKKGDAPHLLVMSATPIPRSLALSIYSDLDISVVRGVPAGRKPVRTAIRTEKSRNEVYRFLEQNVREGGQAYVVYPLIEESEALDLKNAVDGFEKLKRRYPDLGIGLLHGKMSGDEKESVMVRFLSGNVQILITTTVIEVGVDVPNSNLMIIEHAERFGLSQLHQLRGRIGRGDRQSYCILMPGEKLSRPGRFRLQKMVESDDGFEIAEADLRLRGPGDFLGTRQSGLPEFRFADIVEDRILLESAKTHAWEIMGKDPDLSLEPHRRLAGRFEPYYREKIAWFGLG